MLSKKEVEEFVYLERRGISDNELEQVAGFLTAGHLNILSSSGEIGPADELPEKAKELSQVYRSMMTTAIVLDFRAYEFKLIIGDQFSLAENNAHAVKSALDKMGIELGDIEGLAPDNHNHLRATIFFIRMGYDGTLKSLPFLSMDFCLKK